MGILSILCMLWYISGWFWGLSHQQIATPPQSNGFFFASSLCAVVEVLASILVRRRYLHISYHQSLSLSEPHKKDCILSVCQSMPTIPWCSNSASAPLEGHVRTCTQTGVDAEDEIWRRYSARLCNTPWSSLSHRMWQADLAWTPEQGTQLFTSEL